MNDAEVQAQLIEIAAKDDRIRAVLLNGSRADHRENIDVLQDFDVVYFVTDVSSFTEDHRWIDQFGERLILQMPEAMQDPPPVRNGNFPYLMQLMEGHRIDLTLIPAAVAKEYDDGPEVVLLDKDNLLAARNKTATERHHSTPPSYVLFSNCCNEYWWMCLNVAKGLWRAEVIYAKHMFDQVHKDQLMKMLAWSLALDRPNCRQGKYGRHLKQCLEPELWPMLLSTYADADLECMWRALEAMCSLFRLSARRVAEHLGFEYASAEDVKVTARLTYIRDRLTSKAER